MASETPPELIDEATSLIHRLIEGNLAEDGVARLSQLITGHRAIVRLYLSYMHMHRLLPRYVAAQDLMLSDGDLSATMILPALVETDMTPLSDDGLLGDAFIDPPFEIVPSPLPMPIEPKWKKWRGAAAIVLPLLTIFGVYALTHHSTSPTTVARNSSPLKVLPAPTALPDHTAPKTVPAVKPPTFAQAILVDTIMATWSGDRPAVVGARLPAATMSLQSGLARLRFDNNVIAVVKGPAVFEVKSDMQLSLESGTVSVEVPPNAHNFLVVTPSAKVADLGTEFGVETSGEAGTHVEVFQGRVVASARAAEGTESQTLTKNQAAEVPVDASSVHPVPAQPVEFVRLNEFQIIKQAADGLSFHRWLANSYHIRHDPSLVAYYPFEATPSPDVFSNAALVNPGQFDLSMVDQIPPVPQRSTGRWADKAGITFDASQRNRLSVREFPLSTTGKLTVFAWVNATTRTHWATIAKSRGDSVTGQFSLSLNSTDGDLVARVCQADGKDIDVREGKGNPLPTGKWVFAALVADGEQLHLYRDGVEVASGPCQPVIANPVIRSLSIGFQSANDGISTRRQTEGYWNGSIDELAFFNRALSPAEIKQMYEAGVPN